MVAVDEAYVAFADGSALDLVRSNDRVIVLRTLSKSHGLAGLRLGFGIAHPDLLSGLAKVKDSYNVDAVAGRGGRRGPFATSPTRARRSNEFAGRGPDSAAPWPAADSGSGPARPTSCWRGRPTAMPAGCTTGCGSGASSCATSPSRDWADKLRITVGTEQETTRLLSALADLTP